MSTLSCTVARFCSRLAFVVSGMVGLTARAHAQVVDLAPVRVSASMTRFAFDSSEIRLSSEPANLIGTLLKPRGVSRPPVVLFVNGAGAVDRNGNQLGAPGRTDAIRQLAESLAVQGIATLRYDKRGVGASAKALIPEADARFQHYGYDVAEWIALLDRRAQFSAIVVAGHDEGAMLGVMSRRAIPAAGYIALTPLARRADELLREQVMAVQPADRAPLVDSLLTAMREERMVDVIPISLAGVFRPTVQPYLMSWMSYTMPSELAWLERPCLLVHAGMDREVRPAEADSLAKAQPGCMWVTIDNMAHTLKRVDAQDAAEQRAAYLDPTTPLAPGLVTTLVDFVRLTTRKAPDRCEADSADRSAAERVLIGRPMNKPAPESPVILNGEYFGRYAAAAVPSARLDSVVSAVLVKNERATWYGPTAIKCGALVMQTAEFIVADTVEALAAVWQAHVAEQTKAGAARVAVVLAVTDSATPAALRTPLVQRELRRRGVALSTMTSTTPAVGDDTLQLSVLGFVVEEGINGTVLHVATRARWSERQVRGSGPCRVRGDRRMTYFVIKERGTIKANAEDPIVDDAATCVPIPPSHH